MTEQQHPIHAVGSLVRHKNLPDNTLAFVIKHSGESGLGNGGIIVRALKPSPGNPSGVFPTISIRWELVSSS
jgi:hypothetical protein